MSLPKIFHIWNIMKPYKSHSLDIDLDLSNFTMYLFSSFSPNCNKTSLIQFGSLIFSTDLHLHQKNYKFKK
jgi:hypothetical protein